MLIENLPQEISLKDKETLKTPSTCPFMQIEHGVKLINHTTGEQSVDTLHGLSTPIKCSGSSCKGALMHGQSSAPGQRTKQEVLEEAYTFQQEYCTSMKTYTDEDFKNRLKVIKREIETSGTYSLTYEELVFGAKLAWRNASRCIGRIQWSKLEVQDCRHITSTKEMFEALCNHLRLATNNGNIKSMITIFPQRIPGRNDFRIWNPQLISFAGYMNDDGSVIGDAARIHLTRICQRLGWKGKGGRFDVLPWILYAPGEGAKIYEIPEELILTVNIEHPRYSSFSELGIKWYALPAVADMMFDVGGISFTASPFNGWYMATEVGARDLCDVQRYNLSKDIAEKIGLDTSSPTTLWKDKTLIEATLAVLYSYQKNKVTIMDHHSAAESFMKHMESEQKLRGGCPADWVWIVPPISGSITPVFHQEMIVYNLKPSYEYQTKAWITYKWPEVQLKCSFSTLAKVIAASLDLATKVCTTRVEATILFATETGKSETFAKRLEKVLRSTFNTRVIRMQDYEISELYSESFLVIIASTFGSGEPPDNGKEFWSSLKKMRKQKILLKDMKYAVFALGSSQYPDFCNFGKNLDRCLTDLGSKRILPLEMGDELRGQEHSFNIWIPEVYHTSCKEFEIEVNEDITPEISVCTWEKGLFRFTITNEKERDILKDISSLCNKNLIPLKMLSSTKLQLPCSNRQTLLIRMKAQDESKLQILNYKPGDHVAIYPTNPGNIVNDILQKIQKSGFSNSDIIQTEYLKDSNWAPFDRLPPASLKTYLSRYLDVTSPPTCSLLNLLSTMATNKWDKYRLKRLSEVAEDYEDWKRFRYPHLAELLDQFPSIQLDPTLLVSELPLLQPRYYSISSSRSETPDEVHLTMSLVSFRTQDNKGPIHQGVCTSFLSSFPDYDVLCFIRSCSTFHLPEDTTTPIIMVGTGSGIAPFRSFWIERRHQMRKNKNTAFGPMYLFFGCRTSSDNIYEKETVPLLEEGVISKMFTAFSREPDQEKQYVQHKLKEECALVQSVLSDKGHMYVCGDSVMAADVRKTIKEIFDNDIELIMESGRYHEDVFGVLHRK